MANKAVPLLAVFIFLSVVDGYVYEQVIELGQIIRPNNYVKMESSFDKPPGSLGGEFREKTNLLTVNAKMSNLTVIRYDDIVPFSAKGCMPAFYFGDNPANITRESIEWIYLREQWSIIIFANPVDEIPDDIIDLFMRSVVIIGTFLHRGLSPQLENKLLNFELMVIKNLAPNEYLVKGERKRYTGYMLLFEIASRLSKNLPLLSNLVLIDHDPESKRCSRKRGHRLEVLSHDFSGSVPVMPGKHTAEIVSDEIIKFPEHYGTHIEAPYHMLESGFTAEMVPSERALIPCIRVHQYNMTWDYLVSAHSFRQWEATTGQKIPERSFVFVDTYNNRKWLNTDEYLGMEQGGKAMKFMGIDPDAVRWLIEARGVVGLGIDTLSVDGSGGYKGMATRAAIAKGSAIGIANVASVDRLPNLTKDPLMKPVSTCLFVHLRIAGGTGAPVAIFVHTEGLIAGADVSSATRTSDISLINQLTTCSLLAIIVVLFAGQL